MSLAQELSVSHLGQNQNPVSEGKFRGLFSLMAQRMCIRAFSKDILFLRGWLYPWSESQIEHFGSSSGELLTSALENELLRSQKLGIQNKPYLVFFLFLDLKS